MKTIAVSPKNYTEKNSFVQPFPKYFQKNQYFFYRQLMNKNKTLKLSTNPSRRKGNVSPQTTVLSIVSGTGG